MQLTQLSRRHRRIWFLLGWGLVATVVVLSLIPLDLDLRDNRDKLAHALAYCSLSFWFGMLFEGRGRQILVALGFTAMGVAIEFLQGLTDYRTFDVFDMVANAIGAAIGFGLAQTRLRNALGWTESLIEIVFGKR